MGPGAGCCTATRSADRGADAAVWNPTFQLSDLLVKGGDLGWPNCWPSAGTWTRPSSSCVPAPTACPATRRGSRCLAPQARGPPPDGGRRLGQPVGRVGVLGHAEIGMIHLLEEMPFAVLRVAGHVLAVGQRRPPVRLAAPCASPAAA